MTITYTAGSGSEAHLWNLTPDTGADRKDIIYESGSTATSLRLSSKDSNGDVWSAIVSGQFQYTVGINTLSGVSGSITQIAQFKNGMSWNTTIMGEAADAQQFIGSSNQAAFIYERQLFNQGLIATGSVIQNYTDSVWGGFGNDIFTGLGDLSAPNHIFGKDWFFGDLGIDTSIYRGKLSEYTIETSSTIPDYRSSINLGNVNGIIVSDSNPNRDGSDYLISVERLKFSDTNLALDVGPTENAGSVYMLYKAAFNRAPDDGGMGYWLVQKDDGANIVTSIAQGFVNSAEFIAKYGANPTNASYVNNLYQNVLGRAGEAGGVAYWNQELDAGRVSKAAALVAFATLPEGASLVADLIANGIPYTEFIG
jgi:hypothetical protein